MLTPEKQIFITKAFTKFSLNHNKINDTLLHLHTNAKNDEPTVLCDVILECQILLVVFSSSIVFIVKLYPSYVSSEPVTICNQV